MKVKHGFPAGKMEKQTDKRMPRGVRGAKSPYKTVVLCRAKIILHKIVNKNVKTYMSCL